MSSKWLVSNTTLFCLVGCGFYLHNSPALAQSSLVKAGKIEIASNHQGMEESVLSLGQDGNGQTLTQELYLSSASLASPEFPLPKKTCVTAETAAFSNTPAIAKTECNSTFDSQSVLAQTPPTVPPGTLEPTRPGLPPLPTTPEVPETPLPPLNPPPVNPEVPSQLGLKVKVKRVEVLGNTVFSQAEIDAAVERFIGQETSFEDLLAIRTAITDLYTRNGYSTSGAFLPPQDITSGVITIQVVEGKLERIDIEGLRHLQDNYVRSRIALEAGSPINLKRLESALQLLQLDPLLSRVQAELTAGTAPGLSVLKLNLTEAPPITSAVVLDNQGSPSTGSFGGTAVFSHNDLLGFGDRLSASYGLTEGSNSSNFSYEIPLNARDGTLSLRYANSQSRIIEPPFSDFDINARSRTFSLGFRQPIIRNPTTEVALSLSADLRQSQTFLLGDMPFSFSEGPVNGKSKVTALRFTQDWLHRSPHRVLAARSQFSLGIDAFGATINETGTDGRFFSWLGQFQWVQALSPNATLIARVGTQLTPDSLLPLEQFSMGGLDTVRGYRQNQRVADNGIVGSVEVRFPLFRSSDNSQLLQIAPFFDIGKVWNTTRETPSPSTLASIGLGLRWQLDPNFTVRLDYGIPLNRVNNEGNTLQDSGLFFSIQMNPFAAL
jgi:hemolysin activation/secretion protein